MAACKEKATAGAARRNVFESADWGSARKRNWRGRDGNDPSVDTAKDADQRF
jgi:hypothetical protein